MTPSRFDYLFHRHWDNTLTPAEMEEFSDCLRHSASAREQFQFRCLLAVSAADRPMMAPGHAVPTSAIQESVARLSRRKLFTLLGGGIATGIAAGILSKKLPSFFNPTPTTVSEILSPTLLAIHGFVKIVPIKGNLPNVGGALLPGTLISSHGSASGIDVGFPGGSRVTIGADSSALVSSAGVLMLQSGCAIAQFRPTSTFAPFSLSTPEAEFSTDDGVVLTLDRIQQTTQVGVQTGKLRVASQDGSPWMDVQSGELLTVRSDGRRHKQPCPETGETFAWDLSKPLPENWWVGQREITADGPVVSAQLWYDPYHSTKMWQIRSDQAWNRGHAILWPDSIIRARYRVKRPGMSQVVLVIRPLHTTGVQSGCLEINGVFDRADPDRWYTFEARAADMLLNRHKPEFEPPWLSFITIFNTFEVDLGLRVAEFRVSRSG